MSSFVAVIVGVSGREFFFQRGTIVEERHAAQHFRSAQAARIAADEHLRSFPKVISKHMTFRVEPTA